MRALAKINLTLEILGKRLDGYHELHSLVTFADFGDELTFREGGTAFTLEVEGAVGLEHDNLILKAANALKGKVPFGHFKLIKHIPIAAGLGGGSADAACALRLLTQDKALQREVARTIGADVSVCLESQPRFMSGIGHELSDVIEMLPMPALLVNPRFALSTKEVFAHLNAAPFLGVQPKRPKFINHAAVLDYIMGAENSLCAPAIALAPQLEALLQDLNSLEGALLSRLSGSGATCFALFDTKDQALAAQAEMRQAHPLFFVKAVTLNG